MKISELKSVMEAITKYANKVNLDQLYTRFSAVITQTLKQNQRVEVTPHKDSLFKALENFEWKEDLSYGQQQIFIRFGGDKYLGTGAVHEIESILRDERFDPVGVADRIQTHLNETKQLLATASSLVSGLVKFPSQEVVELKEHEAILEIMFTESTAVESIVDLNEWVDKWYKIIRAFGMVVDAPPDSARVIYIQRSSPLVVEVAIDIAIVLAVGRAASFVLDQIERYLRIRKEALEVANLKLRNKKLAQEIEKEAESYKEETSGEIAKKVIGQTNKKKEKDGEVVNAVTMSIGNLFVFLDKGGKLDYFLPEKNKKAKEADIKGEGAKEIAELKEVFAKVRGLEREIDEIRALPTPEKDKVRE